MLPKLTSEALDQAWGLGAERMPDLVPIGTPHDFAAIASRSSRIVRALIVAVSHIPVLE